MKKLNKIVCYKSNLDLYYSKGKENGVDTIDIDGQAGEFTKEEWLNDDIIIQYDNASKQEIIRNLEMSSNLDFFK